MDLDELVITSIVALVCYGWIAVLVCGVLLLISAYRNHRAKTTACVTLTMGIVWLVLVGVGPSLLRYRGRLAVCQSNLKQIYLGVSMYRDDHNGQMPPSLSVIQSNIVSRRVFECIEVTPEGSSSDVRPRCDSDYEYRYIAHPSSNDVIFWDLNEHRPRGVWRFVIRARRPVLYADGHVEALDQQKFQLLNLSTNLAGATR